jgi:hypothetical protein
MKEEITLKLNQKKKRKRLKKKKKKNRKNLVKKLRVWNQREMVGKRTNQHSAAAALAFVVISTQRTQTVAVVQWR